MTHSGPRDSSQTRDVPHLIRRNLDACKIGPDNTDSGKSALLHCLLVVGFRQRPSRNPPGAEALDTARAYEAREGTMKRA